MTNQTKLMNRQGQAITEKELRAALDTVAMNDECSGWRSMSMLTEAMAEVEPDSFMCKRKVDYWLTKNNKADRFFESRFMDGEWCYRSHKFNLCREKFIKTIQTYQQKVLRYPEQKNSLTAALSLQLRAALQPPLSTRRQIRPAFA